ncbi:uncharacterized protein LOC110693710 isoform X2 [Chenopodium quinoa]|uniref:uncharacterized protein LOC110693710 isoform X2 n=1 Tax=Chenopodium quinoa TaxID=63459 RepID=UPI000B7828B1|nr:uncharacterized protein LOC110693710 isoform X2 [Chenopodium quinoa]
MTSIVAYPDEFKDILNDGDKGVDLKLEEYGRMWEATMSHEEDRDGWMTILAGGWVDFVEENEIMVGDGLKFTYRGNSCFLVKILRRSRSKKSQRSETAKSTGGSSSSKRPGRGSSSSKRPGRRPAYHGSLANIIETNEWIDDLAHSCFEPHFKFIFTAAYLKKGVNNVPVDFANNWLSNCGDSTNVLLQNSDEQIAAKLKVVKKDGLITKCELSGVREFTDRYNVQVEEGALIKFQHGHPAVFVVELVLV